METGLGEEEGDFPQGTARKEVGQRGREVRYLSWGKV